MGVLYSKPDHTPVLLDALHWEIRWVGVMETKLKVLRAMRDITQKKLAQAIGVTRQTITSIERGNYNPSLELAFKIARHFEAKIEDIFIYR